MVSARAPLPPADPAVPSRSALSAGPAFLGPERATPRRGHRPEGARGPTRAASSEGSGSRLKLSVNQVGTGAVPREASELPGRADPAALQARLPLGVLRTRGPGRRGLFCSRTGGGGGRGQHSAWRAGPEPPRARPALERSGPEGRSRAAPTHLPFQLHRSLEYCAPAPPSSTARSSSSGGGGGPGAGGLGHSCPERPPAAQAAPRMLWLRLCRRPRVRASPSRPSTRRGRAPSPGGHVARPGRPESGRPPIPSRAELPPGAAVSAPPPLLRCELGELLRQGGWAGPAQAGEPQGLHSRRSGKQKGSRGHRWLPQTTGSAVMTQDPARWHNHDLLGKPSSLKITR